MALEEGQKNVILHRTWRFMFFALGLKYYHERCDLYLSTQIQTFFSVLYIRDWTYEIYKILVLINISNGIYFHPFSSVLMMTYCYLQRQLVSRKRSYNATEPSTKIAVTRSVWVDRASLISIRAHRSSVSVREASLPRWRSTLSITTFRPSSPLFTTSGWKASCVSGTALLLYIYPGIIHLNSDCSTFEVINLRGSLGSNDLSLWTRCYQER